MTPEEQKALEEQQALEQQGTEPSNDGGEPVKQPEGEEPKFTQAQLDAILSDRLAREKQKREKAEADAKAEAERKRLEENEEFKSLAEQYKAELERLKEDARKAELNSTRTSLLMKAGYNEEQIARYSKFVDGETQEEMQAAVEQLKADVPPTPKFVDPNANNGQRQTPAPKDKEEKGRSLFQRLKAEGKIRP